MKHKDFEDFLQDKHGRQYTGTDDCMPDVYEQWLLDLDIYDLIKYANQYKAEKTKTYEKLLEACKEALDYLNTSCKDDLSDDANYLEQKLIKAIKEAEE